MLTFDFFLIGIVPSRLTRENLIKELEKRGVNSDDKENKRHLINLLENKLTEDIRVNASMYNCYYNF